jgi:hypothetical protein
VAPLTVIVAAVLQLLLAVAFLMMAVIAYRYGQQAQRAAEAEVARQGYSKEILIRNGVKFS